MKDTACEFTETSYTVKELADGLWDLADGIGIIGDSELS